MYSEERKSNSRRECKQSNETNEKKHDRRTELFIRRLLELIDQENVLYNHRKGKKDALLIR